MCAGFVVAKVLPGDGETSKNWQWAWCAWEVTEYMNAATTARYPARLVQQGTGRFDVEHN